MSAPHPRPPAVRRTAEDALCAAVSRWPGLVLVSSLGPTSIVVLHLLERLGAHVPVVLLDTGLLFGQTLALRERVEERFGIEVERVAPRRSLAEQAAAHGPALWERDPDLCCRLRKVDPLGEVLAGREAWITGLRRDQGPGRGGVETLAWDSRHGLYKVSPLAHWSRAEVFGWLRRHRLPYNPLLDLGYPSLGCRPCTRPAEGSDERAGRWAGFDKTECGLHLPVEVNR